MSLPTMTTYTRRVAQSSYRHLLFEISKPVCWMFWFSQKRFLAQLAVSIIVILVLAPYTYDFNQGIWVFLTFFAHGLALWGACHTAKALSKIEVELAILQVVEANGENNLNQAAKVDLERLPREILPQNDSSPAPAMIRLFLHIIKEAKDRKFESSMNLIQPSREEVLDDIFRLQNYQKIALWLGILGTFVGILLALQAGELKDLQDKSVEDFGKIITAMFGKLVISFSASLAGLEAAIIIGFFLLLLRKRQEIYFQSTESAVTTMLSVARKAINKDEWLSGLSDVTHELDKVRRTVSSELTSVYQVVSSLQQQIVIQTQQIQEGIDKLPETNKKFDDVLKQSEADQRRLADEMKGVYDSVALKTTLQESIDLAGKHISGSLSPHASRISDQLSHFSNSVNGMSELIGKQLEALSVSVMRVERQMREQSKGNSEFLKLFDMRLGELSKKIAELQAARNGFWRRIKISAKDMFR
jgi:hypothetical protein